MSRLHGYLVASALARGEVLDLGCGAGQGSWLVAAGARRVVGIEGTASAALRAGAAYRGEGLQFCCGDLHQLPLEDESFDTVLGIDVLHRVEDLGAHVREIRRLLRPGGVLVTVMPHAGAHTEGQGLLPSVLRAHFSHVEYGQYRLLDDCMVWTSPSRGDGAPAGASSVRLPLSDCCVDGSGDPPSGAVFVCSDGPTGTADRRVLDARLTPQSDVQGRAKGRAEAAAQDPGEAGHGRTQSSAGLIGREGAARFNALFRRMLRSPDHQRLSDHVKRPSDVRGMRAWDEGEPVDASHDHGESSVSDLVAELQRVREELRAATADKDYLWHQLQLIHGSKMWRLWTTWHRVRAMLLKVFGLPLRAVRYVGSGVWSALLTTLRLIKLVVLWPASAMVVLAGSLPALARATLRPRRGFVPSTSPVEPVTPVSRRPRVLIVSPYPIAPPDHGGGVRLFNLIKRLSRDCDVYVLVFVRAEDDPRQRTALGPYCKRVVLHHWQPSFAHPSWAIRPPNVSLFASAQAALKIHDLVVTHGIDVLQLEYTELAQYRRCGGRVPVVLTEHDVAFRSQRRRRALAIHRRFPDAALFGATFMDWLRLVRHEVGECRAMDQVHTMSRDDARYLVAHDSAIAKRVRVMPNGVDTEHYAPPRGSSTREDVLYVGNFQNLPNVDALEYFVADVWPLVRLEKPDARLTVVGAKAGEQVRRFHGHDGITVVGGVPDLRPYYHAHRALVAPIRAGSGTRLKILEAFASGLPVVSTALGAEGIRCRDGVHLMLRDSAVGFADAVLQVLTDDDLAARLGDAGMSLAREHYDWQIVADAMVKEYRALMNGRSSSPGPPANGVDAELLGSATPRPDVSVVIPTRAGGRDLERCLEALAGQATPRSFEVICIDSGSSSDEIDGMRRRGARVVEIPAEEFNHGLTRDRGAAHARGEVLVFLNQDAVPADASWLDSLVEPLFDPGRRVAAVQGGIQELPDPGGRFFWHSCGDRFYFTRESRRWMAAYDGLGFSTVNCALRRSVWERHPFGWCPMMEDKKWQREARDAGLVIETRHDALVLHSHDYGLGSLARRCRAEGYGWRLLGERYTLWDMLRDLAQARVHLELLRGMSRGEVRSAAEVLFPVLRPAMVFWGNQRREPFLV